MRQDAGTVRVFFDLIPGGIAILTEMGWLAASERDNVDAVQRAFEGFVNRAAVVGIHSEKPPPSPPIDPSDPEWLRS